MFRKSVVMVLAAISLDASVASHAAVAAEGENATNQVSYKTTVVDGVKIFYREAGPSDGPVLLLLHGYPSSSHMFRDLIPLVDSKIHVIAPDYPGFGYSDMPSPKEFTYSFDHLAEVMDHFTVQLGLPRYAIYMQDYGGPVGFRLAVNHPERVTGLIIQNANAYKEGIMPSVWEAIGPLWKERNAESEATARKLSELDGTKAQYFTGVRNAEHISTDAWMSDQAGLDRPGNVDIQVELQADYKTNLDQYPIWHSYMQKYQPPALIVWGKNDAVFGVANIDGYKRDLKDVDVHLFDTGHFALEEDVARIAPLVEQFMLTKANNEAK